MSWGGPAVGAAPYQAPPFHNGQPSFSQPQQYQYGQQGGYGQYPAGSTFPSSGPPQRPPENRPPKKKGNPIITRYPPPPGYRGPAQPSGPYGSGQYPHQHQPPAQPYQQPYSAPSTYPPQQGYSAPPTYPPAQGYSAQGYAPPQHYPPSSSYPQGQTYQYPQHQQPPPQPYSQPPSYPGAQSYPPQQPTYQQYAPQPPQPPPVNTQTYSQPQAWHSSNGHIHQSPQDMYGPYGGSSQDPNATPTQASVHPATSQSAPDHSHAGSVTTDNGEKPQLYLAWDDWDFDFDGAIWPKSNEPVDPNLSLGVIIWRPAKEVTRALPSTWAEAEEQALKPPADKLGNGDSVSTYFTSENSHEAFLNVRQTDGWDAIRDDPAFIEFPDNKDMHWVSLEECISLRDRPDEPIEDSNEDQEAEMRDSSWNVMDNLEQALSGLTEDAKPDGPPEDNGLNRNQQQEDILAQLGVTGAPKPPSSEPMSVPFASIDEWPSASLPPKPPKPSLPQTNSSVANTPQRAHSYSAQQSSHSRAIVPPRPYGSVSSSNHKPPPPPPPERQEYDPWNPGEGETLRNSTAFGARRPSEARSEASNRTLAGPDFVEQPTDGASRNPSPSTTLPQVPTLERSDSSMNRKRNYEDAAVHDNDDMSRQQEDHAKRKRRSQVDSAYSRR